ncbi:hypothetical protein GCM10009802_51980 [Streptomyces synnematoformans]|uniref:Uncharacterized protein n=1 Tax=Streptomyces synnematoformans TaxID=415721 RepID=A0ABN2ZFZ7_9ACTN
MQPSFAAPSLNYPGFMGDTEPQYRAWLCQRYLSLRELALADGTDAVTELEEIARAGSDEPVRERLLALAHRFGVDISVSPRVVSLPRPPIPQHLGHLYVCPNGGCARKEVRAPGDSVPLCALFEHSPLVPRSV